MHTNEHKLVHTNARAHTCTLTCTLEHSHAYTDTQMHIHTQIHLYTHTFAHPSIQMNTQMYTHIQQCQKMYTFIQQETQRYTHTLMCRNTYSGGHTYIIHAHTYSFIHRDKQLITKIHTIHIQTHAHSHMYTQAHVHMYSFIAYIHKPMLTNLHHTHAHKCTYATGMCPNKTHINTDTLILLGMVHWSVLAENT